MGEDRERERDAGGREKTNATKEVSSIFQVLRSGSRHDLPKRGTQGENTDEAHRIVGLRLPRKTIVHPELIAVPVLFASRCTQQQRVHSETTLARPKPIIYAKAGL